MGTGVGGGLVGVAVGSGVRELVGGGVAMVVGEAGEEQAVRNMVSNMRGIRFLCTLLFPVF